MTDPRIVRPLASALLTLGLLGCSTEVVVDPAWAEIPLATEPHVVNDELANAGADLFRTKCSACHYIGGEKAGLGPNLAGVTSRRSQTWMRAMIANPDSMLLVDSTARALHDEYGLRMLNVGLAPAGVRAVLEYVWWRDRGDGRPTSEP